MLHMKQQQQRHEEKLPLSVALHEPMPVQNIFVHALVSVVLRRSVCPSVYCVSDQERTSAPALLLYYTLIKNPTLIRLRRAQSHTLSTAPAAAAVAVTMAAIPDAQPFVAAPTVTPVGAPPQPTKSPSSTDQIELQVRAQKQE